MSIKIDWTTSKKWVPDYSTLTKISFPYTPTKACFVRVTPDVSNGAVIGCDGKQVITAANRGHIFLAVGTGQTLVLNSGAADLYLVQGEWSD